MLTVLAYGTHHYRARKRIPIRVRNTPLHVGITGAVADGAVRGQLALAVHVNERVTRVALYVDGTPVSRDGSRPYTLHWDTSAFAEGDHELIVYARGEHGHRAALRLPLVVANSTSFPSALARNWVTHQLTSDE
jgi:hypothetical protein